MNLFALGQVDRRLLEQLAHQAIFPPTGDVTVPRGKEKKDEAVRSPQAPEQRLEEGPVGRFDAKDGGVGFQAAG